jgi:Tol biopolymer transport system component
VTELDDPNFSTAIFVMGADGSNPRQLTDDGFDVEPTWSPDGRTVAFARIIGWSDEGQTNSIRAVAARGGASREVVAPTLGLEHPDWSPRGLIVFNIAPEAVAENAGAIMTVRPDGSGLRVLRAATDRYLFFKPVWASDGRSLLTGCHDNVDGIDKLCTLDANGRNLRVVVDVAPDGVNFPASGPPRS